VDANTRKLLYCAVVRPKLEYASCVWSSYSAKQRKLIENVQRRATKFILNYPPRDVTYRERLISLNILPLEQRRELHDLTLLYKIKYNLLNVTFNQYLTPATNSYATRNFDPNNYNIIVSKNQEFFRQSYFLRTVILWNNLPPNIKAAHSLQTFKQHLHTYYKAKLFTYIPP
jgi:hypothetical protein